MSVDKFEGISSSRVKNVGEMLGKTRAGEVLIDLKHRILSSEGVISPQSYGISPSGNLSAEYRYAFPKPPDGQDTDVAVGVEEPDTVYVSSDGVRVYQSTLDEVMIEDIRAQLEAEVVVRLEDGRLPGNLTERFSRVEVDQV